MPYAYKAPLHDLRFVIEQVLDAPASWSTCSAFAELDLETTQAVLDEAARFASQVLLPINPSGDTEGCRLRDGHVCTPRGYREAYRAFVASARAALGVDDRAWARARPSACAMACSGCCRRPMCIGGA